MKTRRQRSWQLVAVVLAVGLLLWPGPAAAERPGVRTTSRILYHDGEVMWGAPNVYFILYGCWASSSLCRGGWDYATTAVLTDFVTTVGGSPYQGILTTYPDMYGNRPNGGLVFGGSANDDLYSHTASLTKADVEDIVLNTILGGALPMDSHGIYVLMTSPDVTVVDGFCTNFAQYHGQFVYLGIGIQYAFVGNPLRCPLSAAPQFTAPDGSLLPTPNDNFAADAMVSSLAHAISGVATNPGGTAWYDRYGLENSDKCQGTYGETYTTPNGAQANMRLGVRDYLIQQNWVNEDKGRGHCALSYP